MKAILWTSLVCAAASLLGLAGLSCMSVAPGTGARYRAMLLGLAVFLFVWVRLAVWSGRRLRSSTQAAAWLKAAVVSGGALYVLTVLLGSFG